jgi:hypothetical protein
MRTYTTYEQVNHAWRLSKISAPILTITNLNVYVQIEGEPPKFGLYHRLEH